MLNFKMPSGDLHTIVLEVGNYEVGRIKYDCEIPVAKYKSLLNNEELDILESFNKPLNNNHLHFIYIYPEYECKGYFNQSIEEFIKFSVDAGYSTVTLLTQEYLKDYYTLKGFKVVGELESLNMYLMKMGDLDVNEFN